MHIETSGDSEHWVVVEGPSPGDAMFVSRWLQQAALADQVSSSIFANEPNFRKSINRLEIVSCIEFGPAAMAFVTMWLKDLTAFAMDVLGSEWAEMFAVMTDLGFFSLTGDRYQMTVPTDLTDEHIKSVLKRLADTEDADFFLHQESLVHTMSLQEAKEWGYRLDKISWQHRVADRNVLLEGIDLERY